MSAKIKQVANNHVKNYIQTVFSERLLAEGFISVDNRYLTWYRIMNDHIINTIFFYSQWNRLPVNLCIGYGIHPLFAEPYYTHTVHWPSYPLDAERFSRQAIVENVPHNSMHYMCFSSDAQVYAPGIAGKGIYTFDGILLPNMNRVHTIHECYRLHKQRYLDSPYEMAVKFNTISTTFIEEAIYVDDSEMYPICATLINNRIKAYDFQCKSYPEKKTYSDALHHYKQLREAFCDNEREKYLAVLEQRRQRNIASLRDKFGIIV